jgi:transcriptional regulator with GAF, ATPase, and Fis domain
MFSGPRGDTQPMSGLETENAATVLGLHMAIAELVRSVCGEARPHPEDVLERFARLAHTHIAHVTHAGVMLLAGKTGIRPSAAGGGYPHLVDTLQDEAPESPALDAVRRRQTVRVDDLAEESRWPQFTQAMLEQTPIRSMVCYPLYTDLQDSGALNLYANDPHVFGEDVEQAGLVLATHAAVTMQAVQRSRQFRSAMGSRDIIGQAKGILMERYEVGAGAAFALLTKLSQESHRPVVAIAKEVVETRSPEHHHELA